MQIKWTESAIKDIESIREYIGKDSLVYAERFVNKVINAIENVSRFPDIGRKVKEANNEYLREILLENYRIIYLINDKYEQINIITIFHSRRDMSRLEKHPWEMI